MRLEGRVNKEKNAQISGTQMTDGYEKVVENALKIVAVGVEGSEKLETKSKGKESWVEKPVEGILAVPNWKKMKCSKGIVIDETHYSVHSAKNTTSSPTQGNNSSKSLNNHTNVLQLNTSNCQENIISPTKISNKAPRTYQKKSIPTKQRATTNEFSSMASPLAKRKLNLREDE